MIFSSLTFFIFFAAVIAAMLLTKIPALSMRSARHVILLVASYIFYGWWDPRFCVLIFVVTFVAYASALKTERFPQKKIYLVAGIAVPLVILGIFKYFNFFVDSFAAAFGINNAGTLNIILPVGISFYTFQALSYIIDVKRKKLRAEKDFIKVALYIAFFPQLVAGPIIKAADFLPQLYEDRNITFTRFKAGIQIFMFGLFKKIVIADWLSVFVDDVFKTPNAFHALSLILAVCAYSIQIYFDFSGYSDMAIGCARCLGYDFKPNFNVPYISKDISEFWRRWHISLSTWLKEYLYIPLGGNRKGEVRTYVNYMLTMLIGGLWHGANWTFVFWGGAHGLALCVNKLYKKHISARFRGEGSGRNHAPGSSSLLSALGAILITNLFVCFCWIFFRSDNFTTAWQIISRIVMWEDGIVQVYVYVIVALCIVIAAEIVTALKARRGGAVAVDGFYPILNLSKVLQLALFMFFTGVIFATAYTGENPFVYFQF